MGEPSTSSAVVACPQPPPPPACFVCSDPIVDPAEQVWCAGCSHTRLCIFCIANWLEKHTILCPVNRMVCTCGDAKGFDKYLNRCNARNKFISPYIIKTLAWKCVFINECTLHQALRQVWGFIDFYQLYIHNKWLVPSKSILQTWNVLKNDPDLYRVWKHHLFMGAVPCLSYTISTVEDEEYYLNSAKEVAIRSQTYPHVDPVVWPNVDFYREAIQIFIRTLTGKTLAIPVQSTDTVRRLKEIIGSLVEMENKHIQLVFAGRILDDYAQQTIDSYHIQQFSTVHMVLKVRGD